MSRKPNFTEPQARHVETVLRLVERAVERVDYLLERGASLAQTPGEQPRLSAETIASLRQEFHALQTETRSLYAQYGLQGHTPDLLRLLDAELSSLWEMLEDTRPRAMAGYGPMEPQTASVLEPDVARLVARVLAIRRQVLEVEKAAKGGRGGAGERKPEEALTGPKMIERDGDESLPQ
jgi:hypothetical protein